MGTGYLSVQVRAANGALPLQNARVDIKDAEGALVYELITDESGETGKVALGAPDRRLSMRSRFAGAPYAGYTLEARADGFNNVAINAVHIFDGEHAIQAIEPLPMRQSQTRPATQTITVSRYGVELKNRPPQKGPLITPFVFRLVAIVDPITVHLAPPSQYGQNVQPSFIDYVKNVASSEIYPTWPEAALEANIHAIVTFALNRVFTQWYRSRGYNFDITNSTAYDQYYVHGRTIYESVSKIVDRVFNQYVRLAGQTAPFFTAFCNGTTSTCAGLSQWGTVPLAERGYSPMQILRAYYPDAIELSQTNIVTGIVLSFPGTQRLGSTGSSVESIQTRLNRIRTNFPAIPRITDDPGVFGQSTRDAVVKFQSVFNLTPDGIVGMDTWNKISSIYVAVARLAELDSEGTALGIGSVPPSSILRAGASGTDVIKLQYILDFIGSFYPSIPFVTQNGVFGNDTTQALIAFQYLMGLPTDGVTGPATWNALYDVYWGIRTNAPLPLGD